MAVNPGEDLAATLFADVHYFYGPPTTKPPHHRFDKGSYLYLYENPSHRRARVEIANNAGTPEQDAFDGYLDFTHIEHSYQHPCLVTITVDGVSKPPSAQVDERHDWYLPTYDPKNERKYHYRLHTLDIYFYTAEDALQFVNGARRFVPQAQLNITEEPGVPKSQHPQSHHEPMSPVVQQLENVAISDPSYQDGRTRDSRPTAQQTFAGPPTSTSPVQSFSGPPSAAGPGSSFPGPPSAAPPFPGPPTASSPAIAEPASFAPMAYNPAAPAAPEAIRHREKTPPPEDAASNPLIMAAANDQGQHVNPGYNQFTSPPPSALGPPQGSYFPGPPKTGNSPYAPGSIPSPPQPQLQSQQSFHQNPYAPHAPQAQQPGYHPGYANHPASPGFQSPMQSPGFAPSMYTQNSLPPPPAQAPAAPVGGYSSYSYAQTQNLPAAGDYGIHQQLYKPTAGESAVKGHSLPKNQRGKLEDSAEKMEKGVTSFLKKLEKKYG